MIIEFKVENYLSFKREQVLSLLSSTMKDVEVGGCFRLNQNTAGKLTIETAGPVIPKCERCDN